MIALGSVTVSIADYKCHIKKQKNKKTKSTSNHRSFLNESQINQWVKHWNSYQKHHRSQAKLEKQILSNSKSKRSYVIQLLTISENQVCYRNTK